MKTRLQRINEQIKQELSKIIGSKLKDPRVNLVTITEVMISGDLQQAKVYFTTLGDEKETTEALGKATGFLRTELGKKINLRVTPELLFEYDHTLEQGNRIEKLLSEISNDDHGDQL